MHSPSEDCHGTVNCPSDLWQLSNCLCINEIAITNKIDLKVVDVGRNPDQDRFCGTMDRRRFIIEAGKAFPIVAGAIYVVGCDANSDGNNGNDGGDQTMTLSAVSTLVAGHSHSATIPISDLDSAARKSYQSSSADSHTHTVSLSVSQLGIISSGSSVTVTSSNSVGHAHQFTFSLTPGDMTVDTGTVY